MRRGKPGEPHLLPGLRKPSSRGRWSVRGRPTGRSAPGRTELRIRATRCPGTSRRSALPAMRHPEPAAQSILLELWSAAHACRRDPAPSSSGTRASTTAARRSTTTRRGTQSGAPTGRPRRPSTDHRVRPLPRREPSWHAILPVLWGPPQTQRARPEPGGGAPHDWAPDPACSRPGAARPRPRSAEPEPASCRRGLGRTRTQSGAQFPGSAGRHHPGWFAGPLLRDNGPPGGSGA